MSDFFGIIYYPGVCGVTNPDFAHPVLVNMTETTPAIEPHAQPADVSGDGTQYHFPVTATSTGNATRKHSQTHWKRAWRVNGWGTGGVSGEFLAGVGRQYVSTGVSEPYDVSVSFSFTLTESVPEKRMVDSIVIAAGSTVANTIFHLGTGNTGELTTNYGAAAAAGPIGPWKFPEITDSPTVIGTVTAATWTAFSNTGGADISVDILLDISVSAFGNSSVLRYEDEDGNWQYVSIFWLDITGTLRLDEALPDGYFLEILNEPVGERNPDVPGEFDSASHFASTDHGRITVTTDTAVAVGSVTFASDYSLSPDPTIYTAPGAPTQRWVSAAVEFTDPVDTIVPPQNP
jgi:hypothetical protein